MNVKRLPLLLTVLVLLLIIGGILVYTFVLKGKVTSPWMIVPSDAVLVYEPSACKECIQQVANTPVADIIRKAASFSENDSLAFLSQYFLSFQQPQTLVALHTTEKNNFDFSFYALDDKQSSFEQLIDKLSKVPGIVIREREFNDTKIHEIVSGKSVFSWVKIDKVIAGSFTPVLVEDIVRALSESTNFKQEIAEVYKLPSIKKDAGNLYIHIRNFGRWIALFSSGDGLAFLKHFGQSSLLDVKVSPDKRLILNGFSLDSTAAQQHLLSLFRSQNPVPFYVKNTVSQRTVMLVSYGISNGLAFYKDRLTIAKEEDSLSILGNNHDIHFEDLYKNFEGEIALSWLESKSNDFTKILIIHNRKDISFWERSFQDIAQRLSIDSVYIDRYAGYEIRELPIYQFPEKLFAPLLESGFNQMFYVISGNNIFISGSPDELKKFLDDIEREDTWGKSVSQNKLLEGTLLEANVSFYINTDQIWARLRDFLHPDWQRFMQQNQSSFNALGLSAFQFSHLNNSYYTNFSIALGEPVVEEDRKEEISVGASTNFTSPIRKAWVVRSHVNKSNEVFVQDSSFHIHLVGSNGEVLWRSELGNPVGRDLIQIDYLNNGKLQYLYATPGKLHLTDRLGNSVSPFPITTKAGDVQFLSIVDYDKTKNYRFMVADANGDLYLYDKTGNNLEGWQPRRTGGALATHARHYRVAGKDYFLAIRKDGHVVLMNRRGEDIPNFPLSLGARPSGDCHLIPAKTAAASKFVVVTRDGIRITFNLEGKILSRETIEKRSPTAFFTLVKEDAFDSYIITRQEDERYSVVNEELKEIVSNGYIGKDQVTAGYTNLGGGKMVISLSDKDRKLTYLYDAEGAGVTPSPLEASWIDVRSSRADLTLYYFLSERLTINQIRGNQ